MLNFFIGFAFFEAGAFFGFFVAALMQAARSGEISLNGKEDSHGRKYKIVADLSADSIKLIIGEHINNAYALFICSFFSTNI